MVRSERSTPVSVTSFGSVNEKCQCKVCSHTCVAVWQCGIIWQCQWNFVKPKRPQKPACLDHLRSILGCFRRDRSLETRNRVVDRRRNGSTEAGNIVRVLQLRHHRARSLAVLNSGGGRTHEPLSLPGPGLSLPPSLSLPLLRQRSKQPLTARRTSRRRWRCHTLT